MIEPTLRDRLTAVYETWLDDDDFGHRYVEVCRPERDNGVTSVRQFLEELLRSSSGPNARIERPAALEHPDSTFMQLLGSPLVTQHGPRGLVESVAHHALCLRAIPRLLFEAFGDQDQIENAVRTGAELPTESAGVDRHVFAQGITDPVDRAALADILLAVLKSKLGQRTIRSFFTVDVAGNGYRLWDGRMRAPKDSGTTLARHVIRTSAGGVSIDLMRYPDDEETRVRAYEWCAELRENAESELPDAVAYGMAYCFERTEGKPVAGKWEIMTAADYLADVDLLQVSAFFEQHHDAEALIDAGDLAFVWLWERNSGASAGTGQACLRAALTDLRRRLRNIRTVVIDLKPYQFVVSDGAGTPTTLHIEKLEAVDRLQSFVEGLHLGRIVKGNCRYIVNRDGDDPTAAMRALGLAGLAQQEPPRPGDG
ncbi:MAG: hypothetical protein Q8L49_09250 [Burkholderiaceae bacterium]|nr:hypothetical protein [Burkholderiaceae bacterium]